jgi:hypothetical protein
MVRRASLRVSDLRDECERHHVCSFRLELPGERFLDRHLAHSQCADSLVDASDVLCVGVFYPARAAPLGDAVASQHIADSGDRCLHRPPPFLL